MYCRHCGSLNDAACRFCTSCFRHPQLSQAYCPHCGGKTHADDAVCPSVTCGKEISPVDPDARVRWVAILLAIFLGWMGCHNFYLYRPWRGFLQAGLTVATLGIGALWGWVEMLRLLTGNINTDGRGRELLD